MAPVLQKKLQTSTCLAFFKKKMKSTFLSAMLTFQFRDVNRNNTDELGEKVDFLTTLITSPALLSFLIT